ncbi:acyltransferase [Aureisphaera galaxeae]|uniref:acyltransferase family protein n=1 Tax=Aureisphaera galaxeae TaxID=1538023 RepID=UPI00235087CA|nr:acyltransferase [Aureisphaera galaxeae]MDC8004082.1 acyltransferase [Aureisphaera galaxeae]
MKKIYFPGLNGVRFIAAFLVMVDHTELFKYRFGHTTLWANSYSSFLGASGVTIFFVLSGFLITYLLLTEKEAQPINIKHFYIRRILRIWPLYYFIVALCFFVVPHLGFFEVPGYVTGTDQFGERLFLFSALLANVAFVYYPVVAFANILWSVAVEEQFYLFWPHVIKRTKQLLHVFLILILVYLVIKLSVYFWDSNHKLNAVIFRTRFSSMIIGAIGAYMVFRKSSVLRWVYHWSFQLITIGAFVILMGRMIRNEYFDLVGNEVFSLVVCLLIVNIATNKKTVLKLENAVFNYLGKISYGLYVYHLFAVTLVVKFIAPALGLKKLSSVAEYPIVIGSVLIITVAISHLSYFYFEKPILRKKIKFSSILSGDLVERSSSKT